MRALSAQFNGSTTQKLPSSEAKEALAELLGGGDFVDDSLCRGAGIGGGQDRAAND
jgi:hypothetical protein